MPNVLGNFPSINELLDSPPLKSLVERVNPTRVMSGVRSFVDGMREELQTAVKERQIPSPVALAIRESPLSHWPNTVLLLRPHQPPSGRPGAASPAAARYPHRTSSSGTLP